MSLPSPASDRTVVVTGASSGIGEALARELASRGYGLTLLARRRERLGVLGEELTAAHGVQVRAVRVDLADPRSREVAVHTVQDDDGRRVIGLCNNAGVGRMRPFLDEEPETLARLLALDAGAVMALMSTFTGPMVREGEGAVLNVASIFGHGPVPGAAAYSAAKAFVLTLSEAVHEELQGTGVSCTVLSPGPLRTEAQGPGTEGLEDSPDIPWGDVAEVARLGVDGMIEGARSVTPGVPNQAWAAATRLLPRSLTLKAARMLPPDRIADLLRRFDPPE